ncbi:ParB/RepB/Spo0J family partition protein [Ideonella sp. DXS29W]|uniref:ParB/RepB/Spo0J family partition protein n=1 Tax=Ideonella lacteola TaxID=2984193 RepID=A0ABU9BW28_9BURK
MPSFDFAQSRPTVGTTADGVPPSPTSRDPGGHTRRLPVTSLVDSPYQPRLSYDEGKLSELAESLRHGQLDPLIVRAERDGKFEVISGHRRKRAAPLAQLEELDCRVVDVSDDEAQVLVLAANEAREDFTDYERALAYRAILDQGAKGGPVRSQRQLAAKVGVDVALVNKRLSMLELPEAVQAFLRTYPGAFSSRWVKNILAMYAKGGVDEEKLIENLVRVAADDLQMSALFSVMAGATKEEQTDHQAPQRGLSLHRSNRLFAQVTPNPEKRHVVVKLPGECNVQEVADLILAALSEKFGQDQ